MIAPIHRNDVLNRIKSVPVWDVLVIGGGATGLGIALDAASRGYKVLLVERSDFAKGTSGRSTKLVHGGVRYLAQGNIKLVREASIERGLLKRNATHLVKDQVFVVPVYNRWSMLKYTIGLKLYDWIAGSLSLGDSVFISKEETIKKLPGVRTAGLKGGVLYHDGQFDDARLAVNLAQTIASYGGEVINYTGVTALLKDDAGNINGAVLKDMEADETFHVKAKAVVNATGVFADDILQMDEPGGRKTICASQGIHLVLDKSFLPSDHALMIPQTSDGRVLFMVPWHDKLVVGTTDTPVENITCEPEALEAEIDFVLSTAAAYLAAKPERKDVLSVFAGLRPLSAPGDNRQQTKEISRSHKIKISPSKLFTMLGGKWTTYRKMAEDMLNSIERELHWPQKKCITKTLPIHASGHEANWNDPLYYYGNDLPSLREQINKNPGGWLSLSLNIHEQQVIQAVRHEMARTVEDVLARRTRALLLDARESRRIAPRVAAIVAAELNKPAAWQEEELQSFYDLSAKYLL